LDTIAHFYKSSRTRNGLDIYGNNGNRKVTRWNVLKVMKEFKDVNSVWIYIVYSVTHINSTETLTKKDWGYQNESMLDTAYSMQKSC
jgi:hypothetical protein